MYDLTSFEKNNNNIISIIISGVGDNFGRSVYMDDSHSINSFSDDLALSLPPERDLHGGVPMNILMTTSISGRANISRTTDCNFNNLGKSFKFWGSLGSRKVCGVPRGPLGVVGGRGAH